MSWQYGGEVAEAPDRQELLTALTTEHGRHHLQGLRPDRTPDALYEESAVAFADESGE
jgi:hypothetical protein